jgi:hypothetical protein
MANVLYGVGLLVLLGVFCFDLFTVEGGLKKTGALVTLQAIFYYLGATLLEQPQSELIEDSVCRPRCVCYTAAATKLQCKRCFWRICH